HGRARRPGQPGPGSPPRPPGPRRPAAADHHHRPRPACRSAPQPTAPLSAATRAPMRFIGKLIINLIAIAVLAVGGGLGSAWYMVEAGSRPTARSFGPWATRVAPRRPHARPPTPAPAPPPR